MRIVFYATMGENIARSLREIFQFHRNPRVLMQHVYDIFDRDVQDAEWIPGLIGTDVLIISGDRGRGAPPRLPQLCREANRTHILFSSSMHKCALQFQQIRSIVVLWPKIIEASKSPPGSRYQIQSLDGSYQYFALVKKDSSWTATPRKSRGQRKKP